MSAPDLSVYDNDPTLYLVTSLTAGSSHIITATSRMETILRANKVPFTGVDTATDDRMRSLWGRRARGKKFPGLVREGFFIGDIEQIEEWNEFGELKENLAPIGSAAPAAPVPAPKTTPAEPPVSIPTNAKQKVENTPPAGGPPQSLAMRQAVQEAAAKAQEIKSGKFKEKESTASPTTPIKLGRIDHSIPKLPPSDRRSPKSVPIPDSPVPKTPASPSTVNPESGVGANTTERKQTHRGSSVSIASQEEIKKIEEEQKIVEESSEDEDNDDEEEEDSDEDDEEDDDDDDEEEDDEDDDEDESSEEEQEAKKPSTATTTTTKPTTAPSTSTSTTTPDPKASPSATTKAAASTSSQPAASSAKAGESVGD